MSQLPVPSTYAWPPLPVLDPDQAAIILSERLQAAWNDLEAQRLRVIAALISQGRPATAIRPYLSEFQAAVLTFKGEVGDNVDEYLRLHLGPYYQLGAEAVSPLTWTATHVTALTSLATDTYGDFLARSEAAGRTSAAFARAVRKAAAVEVPKTAAGGRTALDAAKRLENHLVSRYGITSVTYRDGSQVAVRTYARMAARTKSAVAYNAGTLNQSHVNGVTHVEVFDGSDCGWTSHQDGDGADGSIRTVQEAAQYPISHPNCRRAFGHRPDITSDEQAASAQRTPGANSPAALPKIPVERPTTVRAATLRRVSLDAKRAARLSGAGEGAVIDQIVSKVTGR